MNKKSSNTNSENTSSDIPFLSHWQELRRRLIFSITILFLGSIAAYIFYPIIIKILSLPYANIDSELKQNFFIMSLFDGFIVKIKISIITGFIITVPFHLYNILKFIVPGLTAKEIKVLAICLCSGGLLAVFAVFYGYCYIVPFSIKFLTSGGFVPKNVGVLLNFRGNILYIMQFILVCIIIFQFPVVLVVLMSMNIISSKTLMGWSRYIIVGIFVFSAILTPPDFISQLAVAIPLIILFYGSILVGRILHIGDK